LEKKISTVPAPTCVRASIRLRFISVSTKTGDGFITKQLLLVLGKVF
jgi:hypothetical protein